MAVAIRLRRMGKKLNPFYRIVAIDSSRRSKGKPLEELGYYNPKIKKQLSINKERVDYWIKNGALVSETVNSLLKKEKHSVESV